MTSCPIILVSQHMIPDTAALNITDESQSGNLIKDFLFTTHYETWIFQDVSISFLQSSKVQYYGWLVPYEWYKIHVVIVGVYVLWSELRLFWETPTQEDKESTSLTPSLQFIQQVSVYRQFYQFDLKFGPQTFVGTFSIRIIVWSERKNE